MVCEATELTNCAQSQLVPPLHHRDEVQNFDLSKKRIQMKIFHTFFFPTKKEKKSTDVSVSIRHYSCIFKQSPISCCATEKTNVICSGYSWFNGCNIVVVQCVFERKWEKLKLYFTPRKEVLKIVYVDCNGSWMFFGDALNWPNPREKLFWNSKKNDVLSGRFSQDVRSWSNHSSRVWWM